jgi:hypothetical protein
MAGNSRTLSGLLVLDMEMGGLCDNPGHEPRFVDPDARALIAKYGLDALTQDVMSKITCRECGAGVAMVISATSARVNAPGTPKGTGRVTEQ